MKYTEVLTNETVFGNIQHLLQHNGENPERHTVTKAEITDIIRQNGFSESVLFLEPKLTGEDGYGLLKKRIAYTDLS